MYQQPYQTNQIANQNNQNQPQQTTNPIDFNVYILALKSGNVVGYLNNVKDKVPYVQDELAILQSSPEQQQVFINNVCKHMNMTQEQFLEFSNRMVQELLK